ncbi:MAG: hypothetical protein PHF84_04855, partial [bacterium]|nr:hypothetical protein [bacterium]
MIMLLIYLLIRQPLFGWVNDTMKLPGDLNDWTETSMSSNTLGGLQFWSITIQADSTPGSQFLFENWTWANKWANTGIYNNTVRQFNWTNSSGVNNTNRNNFTANDYYTFRLLDNGYNDAYGTILHTSASPVNITSVTDNSSGSVTLTNKVRVRITLSGAKSAEERVYLRYSSDGWASDGFILSSASNTTIYTCRIPAQNRICTVNYYILSTTTNWASGNDLDNYPDLMTMRYNNHGSLNYSYQVRGTRTIDGDPSDWTGTPGGVTNNAVVSSGEWIWTDAPDDIRQSLIYAGGTNNYEMTEFRVTSDAQYLYFLVKMKDITAGYPYIAIAIDTNKAATGGQEWFGDLSDTKVATNAFWEREFILPNSSPRYYRSDWTSLVRGVKSNSPANNCIEAAISWSNLGITNGSSYRLTVMVAQDSNGYTIDRYGSDTMDCITPMPGETWNEIGETSSEGRVHFYFDVDFMKSGGVKANDNPPAAPSLVYPRNVKTGVYHPSFRWNRPPDADSDSIPAYLFQISESTNFSSSLEYKAVYQTNYIIQAALQDNKIYFWRVLGFDAHARKGAWSTVSSFTSPKAFKTIDGDENDWYGTAPTQPDTALISSNEWIWKDKSGDRRNDYDSDNLGNYDVTEARVTFDSNAFYFLFKFQDINDIAKPYVAILISTNQTGGMNWIADDSGTLVGGDYGRVAAGTHYGLYNVIIHDTGAGVTRIEVYSNNGTGNAWYAPPGYGSDVCYVDPTDNLIEGKIARQDLRLNNRKNVRMGFVFCKNASPAVWANSGDSTYAYGTCDAVDTVSLPAMLYNDKYNDQSAWAEDISDGDVDFWVELRLKSDGRITNLPPPSSLRSSPSNTQVNVGLTPVLKWQRITDPDDVITSYLLELSSVTNLAGTVLLRVNLTNTNYSVTEPLPDGLDHYWRVRGRDRSGILTANAAVWRFTTIETQQVSTATTPPFTPVMDGSKDTGWGGTPFSVSAQSNLPVNYAEDLYVSNDPDYLYIGWKMRDDPWDESGSGYDKSAHYGFVFESKHDPFGGMDDPFISGNTTKVSWTLKPDIWVEGWIKTGYTAFGKLIKYIWNEDSSGWDETALENNGEYGMVTNSWAEFRIPLKELGSEFGDKVSLIRYFRPADDKSGVSDSVPYDASCNDYADSASTLTTKALYRIQYSPVRTWHDPDREDVQGMGTMRDPVSPSSSEAVRIQAGIYPYDGYDTARVYYTTNNWATTNISGLTPYHRSANNIYLRSEIGPFARNKIVRYFTSVERNGMKTYNYGSDSVSTLSSNREQARQNAFAFLTGNSAPSTPVVTLSPFYVYTNDRITAGVTSATDADGDGLTCYFKWYRNNVRQTNLDSSDSTRPFQASVSNLSSGETWSCSAQSFDGYQYSETAVSGSASVLFSKWLENIRLKTNSSKCTNNEFIWYD